MFFDNLTIQHYSGPLQQEDGYYPFGLIMGGISSKAFGRLANKKKYNGYEENKDFDLNWYESFYRIHDPQIGRFWQVDPKPTDFESMYAAMGNNPTLFSDLLGDTLGIPSQNELGRGQSETDIKSLVLNPQNLRYLNFEAHGFVKLTGSKDELLSASLNDKGFNLLYDIIIAPQHVFYAGVEVAPSREKDLVTGVESRVTLSDLKLDYADGSVISHAATTRLFRNSQGQEVQLSDINKVISNLSMTAMGNETGTTQTVPSRTYISGGETKRYDGHIAIAPGEFYNMVGTTKIVVPRASLVYHELGENFLRTVYHLPYEQAHRGIQAMEGNPVGGGYGNTNPGVNPQFFFFKK